ncbi:hypothetical protein PHPALM_30887 [Phytophthora palmivora]|uniref:Uncharacterized protein n=1 Tax=Phytophthora palmivora TaxID=4796 RepID=A0A2P4X403_9STRA|nr:hypothetical protein PHPALM_30887 [Phytophthora palmivora]
MDGTASQDKNRKRQQDSSQEQDKLKRRRGPMTNLHSIWLRATDVAVNHLEAAEGAGNVLKHYRSFNRPGILNAKIERYQRLRSWIHAGRAGIH